MVQMRKKIRKRFSSISLTLMFLGCFPSQMSLLVLILRFFSTHETDKKREREGDRQKASTPVHHIRWRGVMCSDTSLFSLLSPFFLISSFAYFITAEFNFLFSLSIYSSHCLPLIFRPRSPPTFHIFISCFLR